MFVTVKSKSLMASMFHRIVCEVGWMSWCVLLVCAHILNTSVHAYMRTLENIPCAVSLKMIKSWIAGSVFLQVYPTRKSV